jgi:HD-GYP domain-containing protein (c-di-GMP phosphodiesterase class II)
LDPHGEIPLRWIEAEDISSTFLPEPFPPRRDGIRLGPLVRSIRELGVLTPVVARPADGRLQAVTGWKRLLAAQAAAARLPVVVREMDDDECRRLYEREKGIDDPSPAAGGDGEPSVRAAIRSGPHLEDQASGLRRLAFRGRGLAAGEAPVRRDPVEAGGEARDVEPAILQIVRWTEACFRSIAREKRIPVEAVEKLAVDLMALAPVRRGRDVRAFSAATSDGLVAHSLIVTTLGNHLAESLGWTPGQIKKFALACLLHDVGMLFIPKDLLLAPRPLSRAERQMVELHPGLGREIIQGTRAWGAQIHLVAQDHHERWNGSGYPGRKKGKEVDLPARIAGFLDCFGALICPRPHRRPLLYGEAFRVLAALTEMGHHDPAILLHFRSVFSETPVGAWVELRDGRIGQVIGMDPRSGSRRRIRILDRSRGGAEAETAWVDSEAQVSAELSPPGAVKPEPRPPSPGRLPVAGFPAPSAGVPTGA